MRILGAALAVFFFASSPCFSEELKRSDTLAADLSQSISLFSELSKVKIKHGVGARRDPLKPLVDAEGNILNPGSLNGELAVQGIVNSGKSQAVLINNKLYVQGDKVGSYRILEVRSDGVTVQDEKGTAFIPLYPDSSAGG